VSRSRKRHSPNPSAGKKQSERREVLAKKGEERNHGILHLQGQRLRFAPDQKDISLAWASGSRLCRFRRDAQERGKVRTTNDLLVQKPRAPARKGEVEAIGMFNKALEGEESRP